MADEINTTIQELQNLAEQGKLTHETLKEYAGQISVEAYQKLSQTIKGVAGDIGIIGDMTDVARQKLSDMFGGISLTDIKSKYDSAKSMISDYASKSMGSNKMLSDSMLQNSSMILTAVNPAIISSSKLFGDFGSQGVESTRKISESIDQISGLASKFKVSEDVIKSYVKAQESVANLETSFIKMTIASGGAFQGIESGKDPVSRSRDGMTALASRINEVSSQANILPESAGPIITEFGSKIPGALDKFSAAMDGSGGSIDPVVKMLQVADGIGMSHSDMVNRLSDTYQRFGNSVDKTMDNLVLYNKTAQELGIRQDTILGFIDKTTVGMESMSDSTESAITMMRSLGKVMRENDVSEAGVSNILSGMAQSAVGMDIGQASFVNQMSGGQGGLAGGFEIELLKQQGDIAQIVNKTMQAMEKIGVGTPTTLQDVQDNPALAGQLLQQREMIKQFGLAKNDQDAYRVLEMMKSGATDELKGAIDTMQDPQKASLEKQTAMLQAMQTSNAINEAGNQSLMSMNRQLSKISQTATFGISGFLEENIDQPLEEGFAERGQSIGAAAVRNANSLPSTEMYSGTVDTNLIMNQNIRDVAGGGVDLAKVIAEAIQGSFSKPTETSVNNIPIDVGGTFKFEIDVKDGSRSIAKEVFYEEIENVEQKKAQKAFTGSR